MTDRAASRDRYVSIIALFRNTARLMVDELVERLDAAGYPDISATYHPVFENIDRDGTRLTDLAARAAMTHQSMGELVATLEQRGYVERRPDPSDGRARLVALTPQGRRLVRISITELNAIEAKWQARWRRANYRGGLRHLLEDALAIEESPATTTHHNRRG
jgi:DNA-binding MarR family transcriptional regulator